MDYIRSTSNPEKLYIWAGDTKGISISIGAEPTGYIPYNIFDNLLKDWYDAFTFNNNRSFELDDESHTCIIYQEGRITEVLGEDLKWVLEYKDIKIQMWTTTLYYLAGSNYGRL